MAWLAFQPHLPASNPIKSLLVVFFHNSVSLIHSFAHFFMIHLLIYFMIQSLIFMGRSSTDDTVFVAFLNSSREINSWLPLDTSSRLLIRFALSLTYHVFLLPRRRAWYPFQCYSLSLFLPSNTLYRVYTAPLSTSCTLYHCPSAHLFTTSSHKPLLAQHMCFSCLPRRFTN